MDSDRIEINRFYEVLSAAIVLAGGRCYEPHHLAPLPLGEVAKLIWPNGIKFKVDISNLKIDRGF